MGNGTPIEQFGGRLGIHEIKVVPIIKDLRLIGKNGKQYNGLSATDKCSKESGKRGRLPIELEEHSK